MQTVVSGDTTPLHWQAVDPDTGLPIDLTNATLIVRMRPLKMTSPTIEVPGVKTDATEGRFSHSTAGLTAGGSNKGVWEMQTEVNGPPGEQTAPTLQNALIRVREGF